AAPPLASCLPLRGFARFCDQEIVPLGPGLDRGRHPSRLRTATGPGVAGSVAIFRGELAAGELAPAGGCRRPPAPRRPPREGGELGPERSRLIGKSAGCLGTRLPERIGGPPGENGAACHASAPQISILVIMGPGRPKASPAVENLGPERFRSLRRRR